MIVKAICLDPLARERKTTYKRRDAARRTAKKEARAFTINVIVGVLTIDVLAKERRKKLDRSLYASVKSARKAKLEEGKGSDLNATSRNDWSS